MKMDGTSDTQSDKPRSSEHPPPYQPASQAAFPTRPNSEASLTENPTQPTSVSQDSDSSASRGRGVLVFVEGVIQDKKSKLVSANIFYHQDSAQLYSYGKYIDGEYTSNQGDLHVACIDSGVGYQELSHYLISGIVRNEPNYISAKEWRKLPIDVVKIMVLWDGMKCSYSDENCTTTMTLKTDGQTRTVLAKMKERGWKDRFQVQFRIVA
ncbi:hypothetical protein ONS95_008720 [Cadophora gregata]|uniref:uncharacterized protein n=1 Tax=Cadophora gregata TaxID=51156 RepID=UPI0026DB9466|nr:uncharacterized protein ONS95_008720 [Cadophora gregata]KAK0123711.1 hypothetical protein ONS95_008720 [Cadophora gregata]